MKRNFEHAVRINKYLSQAGVCSRRQADQYVEQGLVTIDGKKAIQGSKVNEGQKVRFKGKPVEIQQTLVFLVFHKPRGITCTSSRKDPDNIIDYINYPERIYTVGRLDKNSQGLILLTNDGDVANKIMKASNYHEKEYIVTVNRNISAEFIHGMQNGVPILDTVTRKCMVTKESARTFRIVLTQGLNRQIRRMCEYFGYRVEKLVRVRIMNIQIGHLKEGTWRKLSQREWNVMREELRDESDGSDESTGKTVK